MHLVRVGRSPAYLRGSTLVTNPVENQESNKWLKLWTVFAGTVVYN